MDLPFAFFKIKKRKNYKATYSMLFKSFVIFIVFSSHKTFHYYYRFLNWITVALGESWSLFHVMLSLSFPVEETHLFASHPNMEDAVFIKCSAFIQPFVASPYLDSELLVRFSSLTLVCFGFVLLLLWWNSDAPIEVRVRWIKGFALYFALVPVCVLETTVWG